MKTTRIVSIIIALLITLTLVCAMSVSAFAEDVATDATDAVQNTENEAESSEDKIISSKATASAIVVAVVGAAGAVAMGIAISKSTESMARQPEAASKINGAMMLGLVFVETAIIYALIIAILIIFVL